MASFSSAGQAKKAEQFMAEGEKCLKKWSLFSSSTKYEDAAECFSKAGHAYKVARMWEEAAAAYERAAENHEMVTSGHEAASAYLEAAKARKNVSPGESVHAYGKAINIYNDSGRFQQAGKLLKEVGEIHEAEGDLESAVDAFRQAADYLMAENSPSAANACLLKLASIISKDMEPPKLGEAADVFEQLGRSCMEKPLLRMNAKGYWLQAGLCLLAQRDTVAARQKHEDFSTVDYSYVDSREYRFLEQLIKSCEDLDVEQYAQHCFDYDQVSRLDPWKTAMCLRIKRSIESDAGGNDDEEPDLT